MATIDRWIAHWADHRPQHPAIRFERQTLTYLQLHHHVLAMARWLAVRGVDRGDRVVFCGLNRPEQIIALFACGRIGAVLVPLNNRLSVAEHRYQLQDAEPTLALVGDGFGEAIAAASAEVAGRSMPIVDLDADPGWTSAGTEPATIGPEPSSSGAVGADDPVLMIYTSGTTGRPKGAIHSQRSLLHTVLNGVAHQDLTAADRVLTVLPLFHVGGLNIQTLPALHVGATVLLQRRFAAGDCLEAIRNHRPTQTLFVPAVMQAVLAHPDAESVDLGCLRGLNAGSSVIPEHLIRGFMDLGVPVGQVYGSTETGPTAIVLRYEDGPDHIGSCGKPALHTEMRIVDADGVDVGPGVAGEILVRGQNLFVGYWRQPAATAAAFLDGWYRTGDVGRRDRQGFVHIEDRLGDVLISGGENVYPAEVENVLLEHPAIAQIAVIGRADQKWGEVPVAVIEAVTGRRVPTIDELRAWCDERLARFKQPREIVVVDELPRTALGKVTKHVLRRQLADAPPESDPATR